MAGGVQGQTEAWLEADTIALGDQTVLSIPLGGDTMPAIDLGGSTVLVLGQRVDTATRTLQSVVTSFDPGEHWLRLGGDDSLLLVVTDVDVDTASAEIRDIAPIQRVPYTLWEILRWVLLAWAVAAVAIVVWWLIVRKKRHGSLFVHHEPEDTRTPEERALQSLETLRTSRMWQAGKVKEYYTELTDIVRRFIEEATDIRATDMTSDECVNALTTAGLSADTAKPRVVMQSDIQALRDIFTTADLVKFAKSEPMPNEHDASMNKAVEFVGSVSKTLREQAAESENATAGHSHQEVRKEEANA